MSDARIATCARRGVVAVSGADARKFLNDLITCELGRADENRAAYGALLTPQGKILFDFIVYADGERFLFDLPVTLVPDFVKRLTFYRLRAKVEIADLTAERTVVAAWGGEPPDVVGIIAADPRLPELGHRGIVGKGAARLPNHVDASEGEYDVHRIELGVPEGGIDFSFGEAFPHDGDMDQLGGVDFDKGCYVGQEVVSRMQHRGTARTRSVKVLLDGPSPETGATILAGDKPVGTIGSTADGKGIALVRIDRVADALDAGQPLTAGGIALKLAEPEVVRIPTKQPIA
jgi:folate-binding protein YgfZ